MKGNALRWCLAAVMLALLAVFFSTPALAEIKPLPLDLKFTGYPQKLLPPRYPRSFLKRMSGHPGIQPVKAQVL